GVKDFFYQYAPLYGDDMCSDPLVLVDGLPKATGRWTAEKGCADDTTSGHKTFPGYFGYKVLAVSYGGNPIRDGYKGTPQGATSPADDTSCGRAGVFDPDEVPTSTGCAWLRLAANLPKKAATTGNAFNSLVLSASTNSAAATLPNRWFSTLDY